MKGSFFTKAIAIIMTIALIATTVTFTAGNTLLAADDEGTQQEQSSDSGGSDSGDSGSSKESASSDSGSSEAAPEPETKTEEIVVDDSSDSSSDSEKAGNDTAEEKTGQESDEEETTDEAYEVTFETAHGSVSAGGKNYSNGESDKFKDGKSLSLQVNNIDSGYEVDTVKAYGSSISGSGNSWTLKVSGNTKVVVSYRESETVNADAEQAGEEEASEEADDPDAEELDPAQSHKVTYTWSGLPGATLYDANGNVVNPSLPDAEEVAEGSEYSLDNTWVGKTVYTHTQTIFGFGEQKDKAYTLSSWSDPSDGVMGKSDITVSAVWSETEAGEASLASLEDTGSYTIAVGETLAITGSGNSRNNSWSSSNSSIASVSGSGTTGTVTGLAEGTVTITHTNGSSRGLQSTDTYTVTVTPAFETTAINIKEDSATIYYNSKDSDPSNSQLGVTLHATTDPDGAAITWTSSNTSVATVDEDGKVTATGVGTATITATSGNVSDTCEITTKSNSGKTMIYIYLNASNVSDYGFPNVSVNSSGWYTIGYIALDSDPGASSGSINDTVRGYINGCSRNNTNIGIPTSLLSQIVESYNLFLSGEGANDYVSSGNAYHLDLTAAPASTTYPVKINYINESTGAVIKTTTAKYTINSEVDSDWYIDTISGYTFDYANPETITVSGNSSQDVINLYYKKNGSIIVSLNDKTVTYNGQEQSLEATITGGPSGLTLEDLGARISDGKGTNVGTYEGTISGGVSTYTSGGKTYDVVYKSGTLTIEKRAVTLTSASDSKQYDGTPLTNGTVTVGGDGFVDGQGASCTVTGSQTTVGSTANAFTYTLKDGTSADNYEITKTEGTLTVTDRDAKYEVTVKAKSGTYTYDGQAHTAAGLESSTFTLNGKTFTVSGLTTSDPSRTNAGTETNAVSGSAVVTDENGNDVTSQFTVKTENGTLTINKAEVVLKSKSLSKEYDGDALVNGTEALETESGFIGEDGVICTFTGSQTTVGSTANAFTYALKDGTNADNYNISKTEGTLTVTDRTAKYEISVVANSASETYDGTEHSASGFVTTTFTVNGKTYTVEGLSASVSGTNAGTYTNEVTGTAVVKDAAGNDVTAQFLVKTTNGSLVINKRTVTLTSATDSKQYDGKALTNDTVTVGGQGFASGEGASYDVTGIQKYVGSSANAFTYTLNKGTLADNYIITKTEGTLTVTNREAKYSIEVQANSGTYTYDGTEKTVSGLVTDTFTVDGNTYKVSGLTATASGTDANTYAVNVIGTAVVTDADGKDVTSQFSVTNKTGSLVINKRTVTLTSGSGSWEYDGKAHSQTTVTVSGDGFVSGQGASYSNFASATLAGSSVSNTFVYMLNEGTNINNYTINQAYGLLTITNRGTKYAITVEANSATEKYDRTVQAVSGFKTLEFEIDGNKYTVSGLEAGATGTDAGTYLTTISGTAVVKDAAGNDVTSQFAVTPVQGELKVTPRSVTLTSATDSKEFDGSALTNDKVTVGGDGFVGVEGATYDVTGTQTAPGTSKNMFTYQLNGETKTSNYTIQQYYGDLTVKDKSTKYTITVEANSGTETYDGTEKTVTGIKQNTFELDGHTYVVSGITASGAGTDAGTYGVNLSGTPKVELVGGSDTEKTYTDVTSQFTVNQVPGKLTISPREITLTSSDAEKEYDGTALTKKEVKVTSGSFVDGQSATYDVTGSQTLVGESENAFTYTLNNAKASNYTITTVNGTLKVTDRTSKYEIEVIANSAKATYDGENHSAEGIVTDTFVKNEQTYTVSGITTTNPNKTNAGTYGNKISGTPIVKDAAGNDVTAQFSVKTTDGSLVIDPAAVTLTSATDSKQYDGKPLTNDTVTATGFVGTDGATYTVTGSQTLVGSSANAFDYTLKDGTVAGNYTITKNEGTLTVTNREAKYEITVEANSTKATYDGKEHSATGLKETEFTVDGNKYTVSGLSTEDPKQTNAGTYTNNITGTAIVKDAAGNDVTAQFTVKTANGSLVIDPAAVTLTSATDSKQYDGKPLTNDTVTATGFVGTDGATYTVTGSQTLVGSSTNAFTYTLNEGTVAGNYTITKTEGTLTVTERGAKYEITVEANSTKATYDGNIHEAVGVKTYSFTVDGNEYTVSGLATQDPKQTNAGTYTNNITGTPVVKDAAGNDVTAQFTVKTQNGSLVIDPAAVTLTSATDSKQYDGKPLTNDKVTATGFVGTDGATYNVTGTQTLVGSSTNYFEYSLKDGTLAGNYTITKTEGTLTVTSREAKYEVTVKANSAKEAYDGQKHSAKGVETYSFNVDGNIYTVSGLTTQDPEETNAGTYTNNITGTPVVKDAAGNDVTAQFTVKTQNGSLVIDPAEVTLTSATDSKQYDGKPLTNDTVTATGFVGDDGAVYTVTGTQTLVGSSTNYFEYSLKAGTVATNYTITKTEGTLTVTSREAKYEVTVVANSTTATYDGQIHEAKGIVDQKEDGVLSKIINIATGKEADIEKDVVIDGVTYTISGLTTDDPSETDAGTYANNITGTAVVKDAAGNDVTDQFKVNTVNGSLNIAKRAVTLTSATDSKAYDGKALTNDEVTVGGQGFAEGEGATYEVTGSQTLVGSSSNSFTYVLDDNTLEANYTITKSEGTLTVTDRDTKYEITVEANSETAPYDGKEHVAAGLKTTSFTVEGNEYTVSGLSTQDPKQKNAGTYTNNITGTAIVTDKDGNDVTGQFTVNTVNGSLKISKAKVTLESENLSKPYDGTALVNGKTKLKTETGFAEGEGATYTFTGSQKSVGSSANAFDYQLNAGTLLANYDITKTEGTLTVTQFDGEVKVKTTGGTSTYDGKSHGAVVSVEGLPEGYSVAKAVSTDTATHVSESPVVANCDELTILDDQGKDVTDELKITEETGTITITPATVNVIMSSDTKVYDGTALTAPGEVKGLVNDETVEFTVTGSQTKVGSSDNTYTLKFKDEEGKGATAVSTDYTVNVTLGTLTVTESKDAIVVTTTGGTFTYDGQEHKAKVSVSDLPKGYTLKTATSDDAATHVADTPGEEGIAANCDHLVILNQDGEDVTKKLNITYVNGTIKINPATIHIVTESAEKTYDGEVLTADGTMTGLVNEETAEFVVTGGQTEVGSSDNTYELKFKDQDGEGATALSTDYAVSAVIGTLTVNEYSGTIKVTTTGGTYTYNGKSHGATVKVEGLPEQGYTLETAASDDAATDVTAKPVIANCDHLVIRNAEGKDVTSSLTIEYTDGQIIVEPAHLTVVTESASKVYDGKALTADGTMTGLVNEETAPFKVTGSQTKVGTSTNTYEIDWASGTAKKSNYTIDESLGSLTVSHNKNEIVVTTTGGTYTYDGEEHKATVTVSNVPEGYHVSVAASEDSAKHVSESPVTANCDKLVILDADNEDVTDQLNIKYIDGSIVINPKKVYVVTQSAKKVYDGNPLKAEGSIEGIVKGETYGFGITGAQTEVGTSKNTYNINWASGPLDPYTAVESDYEVTPTIGDLTVTTQSIDPDDPSYGGIQVDSPHDSVYDGTENKWKPVVTDKNGNVLTEGKDYTVSYNGTTDFIDVAAIKVTITGIGNYSGTVEKTYNITKRPLSIETLSDSKVYDGQPLTAGGTVSGFVANETYDFHTTGSQTKVGSSDNTYELNFNGTAKSGNYEITGVKLGTLTVTHSAKEIVVTTTGGSFTYDGLAHGATVQVDGLQKGYSLAEATSDATATDVTKEGEPVLAKCDHLKIIDADGEDVTSKLKITYHNGEIVIKPAELIVTTESATKVYDGEALTAPGTIEGFVNGETAEFKVTGSQKEEGSSTNKYELKWNGTAKESNYKVTEHLGTLSVQTQSIDPDSPSYEGITIDAPHDSVYDGTDNQWKPVVKDKKGNILVEGKDYTVSYTSAEDTGNFKDVNTIYGTITGVGNYSGTVTKSYSITRAPLTIVTESATKVYDGKPLTAPGTIKGIVEGETYDFHTTGSQKAVGNSDNTYELKFNGTAKASNYEVTSEEIGTLTVTNYPDEIVVKTTGGTFTYDGKTHKGTAKVLNLPEGYTVQTLTAKGSAKHVSDGKVTVQVDKLVIVDADGTDVTSDLKITYIKGALEINPAHLIVRTPSASKTYDGKSLKKSGSITGFVNGETATFRTTGSQTKVGSSRNTFSLAFNQTARRSDYTITKVIGTLKVTKAPIPPVPDYDDDNGNDGPDRDETIVIEKITDDESASADITTDECHCILHLLIMILAALILIWYTHDMKKRQARIFELEEELDNVKKNPME